MSGLWLAGCFNDGNSWLSDHELLDLLLEIQQNYNVVSANHVMNGGWSSAIKWNTYNTSEQLNVLLVFYTIELLRGFSTLHEVLQPTYINKQKGYRD